MVVYKWDKRAVTLVAAIILSSNGFPAVAENETHPVCELTQQIDVEYFQGDVTSLINATEKPPVSGVNHYWNAYISAFAHYRLALLSLQDKSDASKYIDNSISILLDLSELEARDAEVLALLSAAYGVKISLNFISAIRLGSRSSSAIETALTIAPNNPRVLILDGVRLFNTPSRFGGDAELAKKRFEESIDSYKTDSNVPCWGQADAHYWLARYYEKESDPKNIAAHVRELNKLHHKTPFTDRWISLPIEVN